MSLSNKSPLSRFGEYRPAVLAGLYFFAASTLQVHSREHSSLELLKPPLINQPFRLSNLPDSAQAHLHSTFSPLYSEKDRATGGDSEHVSLRTVDISGGFYSGCGPIKYFVSGSYGGVEAMYRKQGENYYLVNKQLDWNLACGATYRYGVLLTGVGLGRHLPHNMQREHLSDIRGNPGSYLRKGAWQFTGELQADFNWLSGRLSLFSGPVYSSVSQLLTGDGSSYRSFPVSLVRHCIDHGFDIRAGILSTSTDFGIDYFENSDLQTAPNLMPQDIAISNYRLNHRGMLRLRSTDSLGWNVSGSMAGGWLASYNFDRARFTFLKSEALRLNNLHAGLGAKFTGAMTAGISGSLLNGISPTGFLKLSALSAWSAFKSLDYRYTDADVTYKEIGGFIRRNWMFSHFEIAPQLYTSLVSARMNLYSEKKAIVVLFPVYGKSTAIEMLDTRLLLVEPSLSATVQIGGIHLFGSVYQVLPIDINPEKKTAPAEPTEPSGHLKTADNIVTGGTRVSLSAVVRISARRGNGKPSALHQLTSPLPGRGR